ncbi:MAG: hypothetical protein ACE5FS_03160 [Paracoccaceae bacterium]
MFGRATAAMAALAFVVAAGAARAQDVVLSLVCDLGGQPAQMTLAVQYQQAFDYSTNFKGNISGIFPVGVTIYTAGQVVSQVAGYTFRGENEFADFTGVGTGERFRVRWVLDGQRNGLWMIVNPFGGATRHFCALQGAQRP